MSKLISKRSWGRGLPNQLYDELPGSRSQSIKECEADTRAEMRSVDQVHERMHMWIFSTEQTSKGRARLSN